MAKTPNPRKLDPKLVYDGNKLTEEEKQTEGITYTFNPSKVTGKLEELAESETPATTEEVKP